MPLRTAAVTAIALAALVVGSLAIEAAPAAAQNRDYADAMCVPDAAEDAYTVDADRDESPIDEPRADIRELCADHEDDALSLRLRMHEPTDPATDPAWRARTGESMTSAMWFLNVGDGYRFVAEVRHDGRRVTATLSELTQEREVLRCTGTYDLDGGWLVALFDPAVCLDRPERLTVAAVMAYDTAPDDPDGPVALDDTDHVLTVGHEQAPTARPTQRLSGGNRIATAVAISAHRYPGRASVVHLARADDFPDALAAGALGAAPGTDGPILLVPSCGPVPRVVLDEITRLQPDVVAALGGDAAVCDDVLAESAAAGRPQGDARRIERYADAAAPNRFGTAVAISRRAFPAGAAEVYLATGEDFPDALAAGSLQGGPILLVPSCGTLPGVVEDELARLAPERVVALGGQRAVCDGMLRQAAASGDGARAETARLHGRTRIATAAAIAAYGYPDGAEEIYLARADAFPDALAAGVLRGGPVLLVPSCGDLPPEVAQAVRGLAPARVVALGGQAAVCDQMLRHAANVR